MEWPHELVCSYPEMETYWLNNLIFCFFRYDYIHLHQLYNHTYLNITDDQWGKVVYLADWVEYNKYSKEMIGDIGGGILANEIASSFSKVAEKQSKLKVC